ncbi:hypothetical protein FisN_19Lh200 [Fistulifera solaris]|uniref:PH domain-containing protein n=1 Tax=Fistulifera solaris TaxID=1519565 RepID=A0A1Z5J6Y0_FISSO|nr:hypothetical protein FisN_19Lh200 [Fistulifera solaris]|eukprot:GAX09730.1 hypothetical protein FisN_19Lh200 [Fistulifera solaris]
MKSNARSPQNGSHVNSKARRVSLDRHSLLPTEPQIRHSGRAHVRGKIRRVWRPRYLEVWDNGLVRYYEENGSGCRVPRYTLILFQARILDATTFRDMHVGLPTSTYGFMFRGQRLLSSDTETLQCSPDPVQHEQRDFLCAVATLEEAQMWVVALQWAATRNVTHLTTLLSPRSGPIVSPWWKDELPSPLLLKPRIDESVSENEDMLGVRVFEACLFEEEDTKIESLAENSSLTTSHVNETESDQIDVTTRESGSTGTQKRHASRTSKAESNPSKIVITRVTQYRVVRLARSLRFEIAYEIRVLLLQRRHIAEQWSILRTANDFQKLVDIIDFQIDDSRRGMIRQLSRLSTRPRVEQLKATLSVVDSLLRSIVVDAKTVNTSALKSFLCLSSASSPSQVNVAPLSVRLLEGHDGLSILTTKTTIALDSTISTDRFVKEWLHSCATKQSAVDEFAARVLSFGYLWCDKALVPFPSQSMLFLATAVLPLTGCVLGQFIPAVTIRLDLLILSWAGAACFGSIVMEKSSEVTSLPRQSPVVKNQRDNADGTAQVTIKDTEVTRLEISVDDDCEESDGEEAIPLRPFVSFEDERLSSPLPKFPSKDGHSCWSQPETNIFHVRGANYLTDKVKVLSGPAPLTCRGVDMWMSDNPRHNIARHPSVLGGRLADEDTFLVNFLLPFGNLVAYFSIPPLDMFPQKLQGVWGKFCHGDQEYRDARLKLLPVVVEGPWIVKAAVGPGKSPALLGKVIPLQYFFRDRDLTRKGVYEVDVIITASSIAKGILSVVRGHTKSVSIAFAFIIEGVSEEELPESVLCCFQMHSLHLENCPILPDFNLDDEQYPEQ